jgi:RNA polymerase sigma factor (sigma-70 family)
MIRNSILTPQECLTQHISPQRSPLIAIGERLRSLAATRHPDLAWYESTFTSEYPRIFGLLLRLVGDRAEADDLALETFWKLWQQPPPNQENLPGWLSAVAVRLGYNSLRAAQRRSRHETEAGRQELDEPALPDPAEAAERGDERRQVRAALGRLSQRDAQLLVMRHGGASYKEIAAALGLSPGSVGTLLSRAEASFEKEYQRITLALTKGGSHAPLR